MKQFIVVTALAAAMVFPAVGAEVQLTPDDDVQKALDAATPGDTIVLDDGVYYQNVVITRGGSEGKPITLRAVVRPGEVDDPRKLWTKGWTLRTIPPKKVSSQQRLGHETPRIGGVLALWPND